MHTSYDAGGSLICIAMSLFRPCALWRKPDCLAAGDVLPRGRAEVGPGANDTAGYGRRTTGTGYGLRATGYRLRLRSVVRWNGRDGFLRNPGVRSPESGESR